MAQEATVRLRLDTAGATASYDQFVGHVRRNPPAANLPGGGGGGMGGGGSSMGGGVGMGGFDIGGLLTKLAAAIGTQQMIGAAGPAALGMGRDALREMFLGDKFGSVRGALSSRDTVASRFGLAYQLGVVGDDMLRQMYDVEQQYGAGAATKGAARAKAALSGAVIETASEDAAGLFAQGIKEALSPAVAAMLDAAEALKRAVGGSP